MSKDLYNILGVNRNASDDEIKKAYRKLCIQYHPDKQSGKSEAEKKEAEDKFKEINEANSVLSDPEKRRQYDQFGTIGEQPNGFDMNEMANMFRHMHDAGFGHFGMGGFSDMFGHNNEPREVVINGSDLRMKIQCDLEDVYNGATKTIKYNKQAKCHSCGGSGSQTNEVETCHKCNGTGVYRSVQSNGWATRISEGPCPDCNGTGKVVKNPCKTCGGTGLETITATTTIEIPKGVQNGSVIVKQGLGNDAPNNLGKAGDMHIMFSIKQHEVFGVADNGYDLYCKTSVDILDCITGCDTEIKCIDGTKTTIKIPKFSKENAKIVVKGKGMPIRGTNNYGDMIVYIQHRMPSDINKDELKLLDELKKQKHFRK